MQFDMRPDRVGWTVFDVSTGRPVTWAEVSLIGVDLDTQAERPNLARRNVPPRAASCQPAAVSLRLRAVNHTWKRLRQARAEPHGCYTEPVSDCPGGGGGRELERAPPLDGRASARAVRSTWRQRRGDLVDRRSRLRSRGGGRDPSRRGAHRER